MAFTRQIDRRVAHVDRTEQPFGLPRTDLTGAAHTLVHELTGLLVFLRIQARTEAERAEWMECEAEHLEDLQEVADREARIETGHIDPTEVNPTQHTPRRTTSTDGPETAPAPQQPQGATGQKRPLSPAQHHALAFIARAHVLVHESRIGKTKVDTGSSTRISVTTLNALETRGTGPPRPDHQPLPRTAPAPHRSR